MKYLNVKTLLAVILVILVGGFLVSSPSSSKTDAPDDSSQEVKSEQSDVSEKGEPDVYSLDLNNSSDDPITVQINVGDYIQFNGDEGQQHQIVQSGEGEHGDEELDSGVFSGDQAYRVRFSDEGSFVLTDTFNPALRITVSVTR